MTYNLVASRNVLGLRSNRRSVKWSYGVAIPPGTEDDIESCDVLIDVEVVPELQPVEDEDLLGKYHYFRAYSGRDKVRYERTLVANRKLQLELGGLVRGEPYLRCNEAYWRFVTHRFMNLHSAGYVLTDIASLLLLRHGYAPLHCSAFRKGEYGVVVFAPPNTGKTLTTMQACMTRGAEFLAEDLAITDGRTLHSVPWTSTFRYYGEVDQRRSSRLRSRLTQIFPPIELIPARNAESIEGYIDPARILDQAPITHLVLLERGEPGVERVSIDDAFQKIRNLNRYEFNYAKAPAAVAYEFFNPELSLDDAADRERTILRDMITNAEGVFVARSRNPVDYAEMIWSHLP